MGKKNNKRKQKHSQKMMAGSQISQKEQEALKMGMTMEQYEAHMKMQQEIWEEQENKQADKEEEGDEEENPMPKLNPGENFKTFDTPSSKQDNYEEVKVAKVQFKISSDDIDPEKLAAKQKILEMLENQSESDEDQDEDIFNNLNQQGSQGQEKSTRAQRELGGEKNEKLAAQIKSDLDRLNEVKKRRELAAKKREEEKARKLAEQKKKQLEEMAAK